MNQNELGLTQSDLVPTDEKYELDQLINQTVEKYKGNSAQIARFTVDSVTALAIVESRTNELESQNFLKRTYRNLTGKNNKLKDNISYNQRNAQYAAQQILSKLAEQNLLTFDVLTAVNSKLNAYMISNSIEINEVYTNLKKFIIREKENQQKAQMDLEKISKNVDLLMWSDTIKYIEYENIPIHKVDIATKFIVLATDYYSISRGTWTVTELLLVKSILEKLNENPNRKINFDLILSHYLNEKKIKNKVDEAINYAYMDEFTSMQIPLIYTFFKTNEMLNNDYIFIKNLMANKDLFGTNKNEAIKECSLRYICRKGLRDLKVNQSIFELINEFLVEIKMINDYATSDKRLYDVLINSSKSEEIESILINASLSEVKVTSLESKGGTISVVSAVSKTQSYNIRKVLANKYTGIYEIRNIKQMCEEIFRKNRS